MKREPNAFGTIQKKTKTYSKALPQPVDDNCVINLNNTHSNEQKITIVIDKNNRKGLIRGKSGKPKNILLNPISRFKGKKHLDLIDLSVIVGDAALSLSMLQSNSFEYLTIENLLAMGVKVVKDLKIDLTEQECQVIHTIAEMLKNTVTGSLLEDDVLKELNLRYSISRDNAIGIIDNLTQYECIDIVEGKVVLSEDITIKTRNENKKNYESSTIKAGSKQK